MVSIDPYLNETTRHADVILPPPPPSQESHYDFAFYNFSVRNVANFSPPAAPLDPALRDESEIVLRLAAIVAGLGTDVDVDAWQEAELASAVKAAGLEPAVVLASLTGDTPAERLLDLRLRTGAYGLTLEQLRAQPHGVDLGPLQPRLPDNLRTPSGRIELCPEPIATEVRRLPEATDFNGGFVVIGRRHLRSNNSWMHNVSSLVKGRDLCTLVMNTADAARLGLTTGATARVTSRVGQVELPVEVTDDIASGVVSIPHGWGHDLPGVELSVAREHAGVNTNRLTDDMAIDPLSGTAVLNGIPVEIAAAP
jgi:anaerobic selenocysteine-containing dehydrogenase